MAKSFAPSQAELALVNQIFQRVDSQKLGILTGDVAVDVFAGSKLPPGVLGEVWQISDDENQGFLTRKGVAIALRLIGHAQKGEAVTAALVNKPGPLAQIEGYAAPAQSTPRAMSPAITGPVPLTPQDKAKFARLFAGCAPVNGLISGERARDVFMKSKLGIDKLSQIWALADTKGRGSLDLTDFTIGMYLIQACMSGQLPFVPTSLPPGLYEQAGGVATHATGGSGSFSPGLGGAFPGRPVAAQHTGTTAMASPLQQQFTGQPRMAPPVPQRTPAALGGSAFGMQAQNTGMAQQWDVTAAEKANSDRFFDTLDAQKIGFIDGDQAVPFMVQSGLPEDALSQIWDLADMTNEGRLNRDGFAIAMHLIQNKLAGKEVPASLPPSLIPPSMRGAVPQAAPSQADSLRDLFWDDTPPPSSTAAPLQPQSTGTFSARPPPPAIPMRAPPAQAQAPAPLSADPFNAAGPFGNPSSLDKDLLGDSDDDAPAPAPTPAPAPQAPPPQPFEDKSAEIGNTRNQLASTNRSLETAKYERASVEQAVATQSAELASMQTQLSSAKAAYESESKHLATLRERFSVQAAEIQKARHELITAESDVSGMRAEKAEIEGGLLRDKEEVRALQRRMKEVGTEIDVLKLEAEKARKDAKQQKGLLAIAKKQLSQREAERAKVEKELEEANLENAATTQEREAAEAELAKELPAPVHTASPPAASSPPPIAMNGHADTLDLATAQPLPLSPEPTGVPVAATISPMHTGKSNNPFDRLAGSAAGSPRTQSPFLPFTATNVPTPVGQDQQPVSTAEMDDPFGFSQPEHDTAQQPEPEGALFEPVVTNIAAEPQAATPRAAPAELSVATEAVSPHSPTNTDFFQTPPSTAVPSVHTQSPKHSMAPAEIAAEAASRGEPRSIPGGFPGHEDSMSPLQEKVIDESDSEDEDEDDEVPLAALADKGKGKRPTEEVAPAAEPISPSAQEISASTFDDAFGDGAATPKVATPRVSTANAPPVPSLSAFDNAFESVAAAAPPVASTNVFGNAFEPAPVAAPVEQPKAAPVNGLNEFDEAMGKIGGQTTGTSAPFSFDTAFDDNFDFSSATDGGAASHPAAEAVKAPQATPAPATNGFNGVLAAPVSAAAPIPAAAPVSAAPPGLPPVSQQSFSFDDVFSSSVAAPQAPPAALQHTPSFDDAFGFTPASPTGDQAAPASSKMSAISQFQAPPGQHPSIATPSSPIRGSSASSMTRSPSPPSRTTSPPPRHQSPRPRASESTSSIHEKPEKDKKSSRLSIRLPFGKKKKDKAPPMPSGSTLAPPAEEPRGASTPAAEDDIESVKTICAMGFSRRQAVDALEACDYDVQKALNSLLGAQ